MTNSKNVRKDDKLGRLALFDEFSSKARDDSRAGDKKVRTVVTPLVAVELLRKNWDEGFRVEHRVLKTVTAILAAADVPDMVGKVAAREIMGRYPKMLEAEMKAEEAIFEALIEALGPYDEAARAAVGTEPSTSKYDTLIIELDEASQVNDKERVKAIQEELIKLARL